jgi:hypothetical protein
MALDHWGGAEGQYNRRSCSSDLLPLLNMHGIYKSSLLFSRWTIRSFFSMLNSFCIHFPHCDLPNNCITFREFLPRAMRYQSEMLAKRAASHRAQHGQVHVGLGAERLDQYLDAFQPAMLSLETIR